jgi:hypothetical protein
MSQTPVPRHQMETWASNKAAHPGFADRAQGRRTPGEVQRERTAKAEAKAAREKAKQNGIDRIAAFELDDMAKESLVDATPRPPFTPKLPRSQTNPELTPLNYNPAYSDLTPLPLTAMRETDSETSDDPDGASSVAPRSEKTYDDPGSAVESVVATPPPQKKTARGRRAATAATIEVGEKINVDKSGPDVDPEATPAEPRQAKGKKRKVRDEINTRVALGVAAKRTQVVDANWGDGAVAATPRQRPSSRAPQPVIGRKRGEDAMLDMMAGPRSKRTKRNKDEDNSHNT